MPIRLINLISTQKCSKPTINRAQNNTIWVLIRYYVFVGGNLVLRKSKKQSVVSRSSTEFEYGAMTQSVYEIMWLHQLLMEVT